MLRCHLCEVVQEYTVSHLGVNWVYMKLRSCEWGFPGCLSSMQVPLQDLGLDFGVFQKTGSFFQIK